MSSLGEKLVAKVGARDVAGFVPPYMAEVCREATSWPINQVSSLAGDDLLLVDARVKAEAFGRVAQGAEPGRLRRGRQLPVCPDRARGLEQAERRLAGIVLGRASGPRCRRRPPRCPCGTTPGT